ncbi:hypothetical protein [Mycoplasma suis]|uniref:Uncharacterized protein n=1 Tax=Mycoplasma suis (strain Illinois) TaxID=768700 RepID=F0QRQ3_MYCSL|nr:hypothetical protein [Mycoplasma suis]ADX98173.1 hypothetical protein MSU_0642 [Mycoplasma suis str. Illinois]
MGGKQETEGKRAKETLREVRKQISSERENIKKIFQKSDELERTSLSKQKDLIDSSLLNVSLNILSLERLFSSLYFDGQELQEKSNEIIKKLNETKQKLSEIHKEWLEVKEKMIFFQNYEGVIKNIICKNSQFKEKNQCDALVERNK